MSDVLTFKLRSGEEFPVVLVQQGDSMSFSPWIATSKTVEYDIPTELIMFANEPLTQLVEAYNAQFNPGAIIQPPTQIITG